MFEVSLREGRPMLSTNGFFVVGYEERQAAALPMPPPLPPVSMGSVVDVYADAAEAGILYAETAMAISCVRSSNGSVFYSTIKMDTSSVESIMNASLQILGSSVVRIGRIRSLDVLPDKVRSADELYVLLVCQDGAHQGTEEAEVRERGRGLLEFS